MSKSKPKNLVQIIKDNPGCTAIVDNDSWYLMKAKPPGFDNFSEQEKDEWSDNAQLASSHDELTWPKGRVGFSSCCYGCDILEALAIIVGINVESV